MGTDDLVTAIGEYLLGHPKGKNHKEVTDYLDDIKEAEYLIARGNIKAIAVNTAATLRQKKDAITTFLGKFDLRLDANEKAEITAARNIATEMLTERQYHCKLIRTAGLDTPRDHGVEIFLGGKRIANYDDSGDVREKNWNREFTVNWKSGIPIKVKLVNYDGINFLYNQDMAYFNDTTPVAIVLFTRNNRPSLYATTGKWFGTDFIKTRPDFRIEFSCEELPSEKLEIISDYLLPGDKW